MLYGQISDCYPLLDRYLDLLQKRLAAYPGKSIIDFTETRLELFS